VCAPCAPGEPAPLAPQAIEKEVPLESAPDSLLRNDSGEASGCAAAASLGARGAGASVAGAGAQPCAAARRRVRGRFERRIREAQNAICAAVEAEDGGGRFREDAWCRPGGGGGVSRVLQVPACPRAPGLRPSGGLGAGSGAGAARRRAWPASVLKCGAGGRLEPAARPPCAPGWSQPSALSCGTDSHLAGPPCGGGTGPGRRHGEARRCTAAPARAQDGAVWEKAGVGVSVVYGTMPPEAYRAARGAAAVKSPSGNGVRARRARAACVLAGLPRAPGPRCAVPAGLPRAPDPRCPVRAGLRCS